MDPRIAANRAYSDELATIHAASAFYDVLTAVAASGLTIEFVREHPSSPSRYFESMRQDEQA